MSKEISQIQLPDPSDTDPHPRLLLDGYGIHAGQSFRALFLDGWHEITLEVSWKQTGLASWYISTLGYSGVCPVGCLWNTESCIKVCTYLSR